MYLKILYMFLDYIQDPLYQSVVVCTGQGSCDVYLVNYQKN